MKMDGYTRWSNEKCKRERNIEPVVSYSLYWTDMGMGALYKHVPRDGARSTTPMRNAEGTHSQYLRVTLVIGYPSPAHFARLSTSFQGEYKHTLLSLLWRSGHSIVAIGTTIAQHSPSQAALQMPQSVGVRHRHPA
jgi:hypothetical protein